MEITKHKLKLLFFSIILLMLLPIYKLWYIQFNENIKYTEFQRKLPRQRGNIYDRNGELLVTSNIEYEISINPKKVKNKDKLFPLLTTYFQISYNELLNSWTKNKVFKIYKGFVNGRTIDILKKNKDRVFDGVLCDIKPTRVYLFGDLALHLIGKTDEQFNGISGIEYYYDDYLKDEPKIVRFTVDGLGNEIFKNPKLLENNSANLYLTIDKTIQSITDSVSKTMLNAYNAKMVSIAVQVTNTGEILALSSYPTFSTQEPLENMELLKNPLVQNVYEPASLFKPIIMAIAIEEGVYNIGDVINCENGEWKYHNMIIRDLTKFQNLTLEGIIAYSSNIGMSKIGAKLGYQTIYRYLKREFSLESPTGIDLPAEATGRLFSPSSIHTSVYTPVKISHGYEILVSPLQILSIYSAIGNGGYIYQPYVVKKIEFKNKKEIISKPKVIRRILSQKTITIIKEMMKKVVEYGTGKKAKVLGYTVAGKTGTAEKYDPVTKSYSATKNIVFFCGFLPADEPLFTILVIIDEPQPARHASETAAPIFSEVATKIMNYYEAKKYAQLD